MFISLSYFLQAFNMFKSNNISLRPSARNHNIYILFTADKYRVGIKVRTTYKKFVLSLFLVSLFLVTTSSILFQAYSQLLSEGRYGKTLLYGVRMQPIHNFNTNFVKDDAAQYTSLNIFSKLVQYNRFTGEYHPSAAVEYEISSDVKTYTFHLAHNITWHDGVPMTSEDVKFTLELLMIPGSIMYSYVADIDRIETPDNFTVKVMLKKPNGAWLSSLSLGYGAPREILPKHLYEGTDVLTNPYNAEPIGTGPFKFVELTGEYMKLKRNENYFKSNLPYLDEIIVKFYPDSESITRGLLSGEIYAIREALTSDQMDRIMDDPNIEAKLVYTDSCHTLSYNMMKPPLDDIRCRRALAHAIDREEIIDLFGSRFLSFDSGIYPGAWYDNPEAKYPEYNLTKAEELLDEAGYERGSDGVRMHLSVILQNWSVWPDLAELLRYQFSKIGVDLTVEILEGATWTARMGSGNFDMTLQTPTVSPDPDLIRNIVHSTGNRNCMRYNNSRVDELFDLGMSYFEKEDRRPYYDEIQEIIAYEQPTTNIMLYPALVGHYKGWHGFSIYDVSLPLTHDSSVQFEYVWSDEGSKASPEEALSAIDEASTIIDDFKAKDYDVSVAQSILNKALDAYDRGEYDEASLYAKNSSFMIGATETGGGISMEAIAAIVLSLVALGVSTYVGINQRRLRTLQKRE